MDTRDFLAEWNVGADSVDFDKVVELFQKAMRDGLEGKPGSIGMIPSYVTIPESVPSGKPVIVLDAGGTNFRSCLVEFDEQGHPTISDWKKTSMPGIDREVSAAEFFSVFADQVERLVDKSCNIGFCFSYPIAITPEKDGIPLIFGKEIKAKEVIGKPVGKSLLDELARRGHDMSHTHIAVINDTVATLLAGAAGVDPRKADGFMGLILGTGTNLAYIEQNVNIPKIPLQSGCQCVNMESGNFDVGSGRLDNEIFASTKDPQHFHLEKMVSGAYLGLQAWKLARHAAEEHLFSPQCSQRLLAGERWTTIDVSKFLSDSSSPIQDLLSTPEDKERMLAILRAVVEKAAKLTAAGVTATVLHTGLGKDPQRPVVLNVDGTTYYQTKGLKEETERYLSLYLEGKNKRYYRLLRMDDAPTIGAAIAGLSE